MAGRLSIAVFSTAVGGLFLSASSYSSRGTDQDRIVDDFFNKYDLQSPPNTGNFQSFILQPSIEVVRGIVAFIATGIFVFFRPIMEEGCLESSVEMFIVLLLLVLGWKTTLPRDKKSHPAFNVSKLGLSGFLTRPWRGVLYLYQRRRLYAEKFDKAFCGSSAEDQSLMARIARPSAPGSHGLHDWHEAARQKFLMPSEVAVCCLDSEVGDHVCRLLADQWDVWDDGLPCLKPVPEHEPLVFDS